LRDSPSPKASLYNRDLRLRQVRMYRHQHLEFERWRIPRIQLERPRARIDGKGVSGMSYTQRPPERIESPLRTRPLRESKHRRLTCQGKLFHKRVRVNGRAYLTLRTYVTRHE